MSETPTPSIFYKRARFKTSLPVGRFYSPSHYWLVEDSAGTYRVGFTKFATRMLGDFVELKFEVALGQAVIQGEPIGSIEGFKAISDIYSVAEGQFAGANGALDEAPTLLERQPYEAGWIYRLENVNLENMLDVHAYIGLLDATIDRMLEQEQEQREKSC